MEILEKSIMSRLLNVPNCKFYVNEDLKNHLSFRPEKSFCKGLLVCQNETALLRVLRILKNKCTKNNYKNKLSIKHCILGNGTNVIFKDNFFDGFVVKLGKNFCKIKKLKTDGNYQYISVGAGTNLYNLNNFLKENGLGGMEWSFGIPGSLGGAVIMNAGAFGHEICEFVESVKILKDGKFVWMNNFDFEYRNSSFKKNNDLIVEVILKTKKSEKYEIEKLQKGYLLARQKSQPYEFASAGSVFKRIIKSEETIFPAKLIDKLGLKNVTIGGAEISGKHAGFIINKNSATAKDFIELSSFVSQQVKENYNLDLDLEVEIIE